jgi:hypothetical protein
MCAKTLQISVSTTYMYCGTENGLLIIDLTNPTNPEEKSFLEIGQVNDLTLQTLFNQSIAVDLIPREQHIIFPL